MSGITLSTRPKTPVIFNSDRFTGLSAYEVAVDNGFVGTQAEWLESLIGADGASAYQVAVDGGFVGTESEWLASLIGRRGEQGREIELQVTLTMIQWRYAGDEEWTDLYDLSGVLGEVQDVIDLLNGDLEGDIDELLENLEGI